MRSVAAEPSTIGARERAKQIVAVGDLRLAGGIDGPTAAKAALADYRTAARFVNDDADIEARQAILYTALGKHRDADRAISRAEKIDGRLARTIDAAPTVTVTEPVVQLPGLSCSHIW